MEFKFNEKIYNVNRILNRMEHKLKINELQAKIKNNLIFADSQMTVYTKTNPKIELSKGCQACKTGAWWCLFVGNDCNLRCKFCPQEKSIQAIQSGSHPRSIARYWIDDVKFYSDKFGNLLTGISYSGGEPLMYLERILEIASHIQKTQNHIYQWVYTNGILVTEDNLKALKEVGIKEIRVDLTATDFDNKILDKLELIKKIIGKVTVEVVSIVETYSKLVEEKNIHKIIDCGVEQLNLAELTMVQPINWESYATDQDIYVYDDIYSSSYSPTYSRQLTLVIMQYAIENKLNILINDCSNDAKHLQRLMRTSNLPKYIW